MWLDVATFARRAGVRTSETFDDAVVGAGILGLAHAYHLARRGRRVVVIERDDRARGASVRNFGMLWPIGQPRGALRELADRSLSAWLEVLGASGIWHRRTGSLHLAHRDDEAAVLAEFASDQRPGEGLELLEPAEVIRLAPRVRPHRLIRGLWSPHEVAVDPREVAASLPGWLAADLGVTFRFGLAVTGAGPNGLSTTAGPIEAGRVWICSGDELRYLYPDDLRRSGLVRCKLQMLRTRSAGPDGSLGPMLAAGLTLRHYAAFRECPGLDRVRARIASESPRLDRFGIHVLVSQNALGELAIGDSHEYGEPVEPFDSAEIEGLILDHLGAFLDVDGLEIASRWHGTYAKHPERPYVRLEPAPGVVVVTGVGGAGMTLSFGLAERVVADALDDR